MKIVVVENPRPLSIEHYNDVANAPLSAALNSGYALAVAREAGWEVAHLDFTCSLDPALRLAETILDEDADLVLFHWVYSWGEEHALAEVIRVVKQQARCLVGAFGLFPTLSREKLARHAPHLDFILVGEFEATLKELLLSAQHTGRVVPAPGVSQRGETFKRRELISDLSQLPHPDDVGINGALNTLNLAASRGCFGCCSFCFITSYYGCQRRRVRSVDSLERELDARLGRKACNSVYFIDPTFIGPGSAQKVRARSIGRALKERRLSFGFETRVDTIDEELVRGLAADGATDIFLGVESGCDAALQRMNKRVSKQAIRRAVRSVQDAGVNLHAGFIMFEPDTTMEELQENYQFLEDLGLLGDADRTVNLLYHSQIVLYGSRGWERFEKEGRLLRDERLPFEANFIFQKESVARVCRGMKRVATEYFLGSDAHYQKGRAVGEGECCRTPRPRGEANDVLKEAFVSLVRFSDSLSVKEFARLEDTLVANVGGCF